METICPEELPSQISSSCLSKWMAVLEVVMKEWRGWRFGVVGLDCGGSKVVIFWFYLYKTKKIGE